MSLLLLLAGSGAGGGDGGGGGDPATLAVFDGVHLPLLTVEAGFGGGTPAADALRLGIGPGLGTGRLGSLTLTNITADVDAITLALGGLGDTGLAEGSCELEIDNTSGDYDPENLAGTHVSGGVSLVDLDVPVQVKLTYDGVTYPWFSGVIDEIIPNDAPPRPLMTFKCLDAVGVLGRARLATIDPSFDGDTTGERIGRILDAAGHPSALRQVDLGRSQLPATTYGDSAFQLIDQVVRTEFGLCWATGDGTIVFYDRYKATTATRSTTVQATIVDTGPMSGLERSKSRERMANSVHVTRQPIPAAAVQETGSDDDLVEDEPVEQVAQDAASIAKYGVVSYAEQIGELHLTDEHALAMAQWVLPRFPTPRMLIAEVAADPMGWSQWPELLGLRLLDRVRIQRDYGPATPIDAQLHAKRISLAVRKDPRAVELTIGTDTPPPAEISDALKLGIGPGLGTGRLSF